MAGAPQRPPQAGPPGAPGGQERRKNPQPPPPAPEAPPEKGGGRRNAMLPAIVVAVALVGAAFVLKGGGGGDGAAAVATTPAAEEPAEEPGNPAHVRSLDPVTLNLRDGSLAKVAIAIEIADELVLEELGDDASGYGARALDELIQLMGEHTADELTAAGGKAKIKAELTKRVGEAYHGEVVAVYFTELVIP